MFIPDTYLRARVPLGVLLILCMGHRSAEGSTWTYKGDHGQEHWPASFPPCGGNSQSPINIDTDDAVYNSSLPPIQPIGYGNPGQTPFTLANNGHTVTLSLPSSMRLHGLQNNYTAAQLHLHWGSKLQPKGSEHYIDDEAYPAELHIVHYNSDKYESINEAVDKTNGLAVLGILIATGFSNNAAYDNILGYLDKVSYEGEKVHIPPFNLEEILPTGLDQYFRYSGSLTTPPCFPSVTWTVFNNPVKISKSQMEKLSTTLHSSPAGSPPVILENNGRSIQPVNQRTVFASFEVWKGMVAGVIVAIVLGVLGGLLFTAIALYFVVVMIKKPNAEIGKA